jgi:hypothetical protein
MTTITVDQNLQLVNVSYTEKSGHPNRLNFFRDPKTGNRYVINSTRKAITSIKMHEIKHIKAEIVDDDGGIGVLYKPWVSDPVEESGNKTNHELDI